MPIRTRSLAILAGIVFALSLGLTVPAFAGQTPAPYPSVTPSQPVVTPSPLPPPVPVAVPWQWTLQTSDTGRLLPAIPVQVNDVESGLSGILMRNWRDIQITPFLDRFQRGPNSVTLAHDSLFQADVSVNLRVCSVALDQSGRFRIVAGTGTGAGFFSRNGRFVLRALIVFPLRPRTGFCPLAFVGTGAILRFLAYGHGFLPQPLSIDAAAAGRADLFRFQPPVHIFSPTNGPTVSPSDYVSPTNS